MIQLKKRSQLSSISKEQLFEKLFPNTAFSDIKMRNLMRKLTKVLEDFLIYKELEQATIDREIVLNKIYRKRNIFSLFEKSGNKINKDLEAQSIRGSHYFLENYQWQKQHYFHPNTEKNDTSALQLQEAFRHLHHFYSIEKLHIEVELRNQERVYNKQYDDLFFDVNINDFAAPALLKKVSELVSTQNLDIYEEVKTLFYERLEELSEGDRNVIYACLLNFLIKKSNSEGEKYTENLFQLYKFGVEKRILYSDNQISGSTYYNIVTIGSKLSAFEWIEKFMKQNTNNIVDQNQKDFETMSKAQLYFYQKNFSQVLSELVNFEFNHQRFNFPAKVLICKTYFEKSLSDNSFQTITENVILSFEKYIKRSTSFSNIQKQPYQNFIYYLMKILKLNNLPKGKSNSRNKIKKEISQNKNVANKEWLIKKISGKTS